MIKNHINYALRHLSKNQLYTVLNLFGLSVGLACFALIALWINSEYSYDRNGLGNATAVTEDTGGKKMTYTISEFSVDFDYLNVYEMKLVAGRDFRIDNAADSTRAFIVNETFAKTCGYADAGGLIGKAFHLNGTPGEIIGVVQDFNFNSLQHKVEPVCIHLLNDGFSRISIRLNNDQTGLTEIQRQWKKHFPGSVIQYSFYKDSLASSYQAESRFSAIFLVFSFISLSIALLGLFALVSYTVERRSKEIGVRKVLGASVSNILYMISSEFMWLVALSSLAAIPLGYYFMNEWLSGFAYHVPLNAFIFVSVGALVIVVAFTTVGLRTLTAASANPVDKLRSE